MIDPLEGLTRSCIRRERALGVYSLMGGAQRALQCARVPRLVNRFAELGLDLVPEQKVLSRCVVLDEYLLRQ